MCISELELAAFHEGGHVVYAEMSGYKSTGINLDNEIHGNGVSGFRFQNDRNIVNELIRFENTVNLNTILSLDITHTSLVASRIFNIFAAGSCAEYIFRCNRNLPQRIELEISGHDLTAFDHIESFVNTHLTNIPLRPNLTTLLLTTNQDDIWMHINALAQSILQKENHSLTSREITQVLQGTNFYEMFNIER